MTRIIAAALAVFSLAVAGGAGPATEATAQIEALVSSLQSAVRDGDERRYLSYADLSDPVFALEHTRWARDWAEHRSRAFTLTVGAVTVTGDEAAADLAVRWQGAAGPGMGASLPVTFRRVGGVWRYAGERWVTLGDSRFKVSAPPGLEGAARSVLAVLPEVYEQVSGGFGSAPRRPCQFKLYASPGALAATVSLNLPSIVGWNEPGEAIKLVAASEGSMVRSTLAHELTHHFVFEQYGEGQIKIPWWLHEGLAQYLASGFWTPEYTKQYLGRVVSWHKEGGLASWEAMSDYEATPLSLWRFVYPQGYALVRYVTESYGLERRERWLAGLADAKGVSQATSAAFGLSFEELDRAFRKWLAAPDK